MVIAYIRLNAYYKQVIFSIELGCRLSMQQENQSESP